MAQRSRLIRLDTLPCLPVSALFLIPQDPDLTYHFRIPFTCRLTAHHAPAAFQLDSELYLNCIITSALSGGLPPLGTSLGTGKSMSADDGLQDLATDSLLMKGVTGSHSTPGERITLPGFSEIIRAADS